MTGDGTGSALGGLRVLELGQLLAGPFAGRLLADFGAEVIKVEAPGKGDPMRDWGHHRLNGRALWWPSLARNKKSICLDLRRPGGQDILLKLARQADVLIENFRPGTLEAWNLGPTELHDVNPRLIVARVSGFGQTGPYSGRAGFASVGEAMSGLRYLNGFPDMPPPRTGISLGDSLAALFAVQGILMALYWRDARGGQLGQVIDASIVESCFALTESTLTEYEALGVVRGPSGTGLVNVAPSNIYQSRDGKWMVIAANTDSLFGRLCTAMGRSELSTDPRFQTHIQRGEHAADLDSVIAEWAAQFDAADVDRILTEAGVACGPIFTIADIAKNEHYLEREMILRIQDSVLGEVAIPGISPKLDLTPGDVAWLGPSVPGSDTRDILERLLAMGDDEIAGLEGQGIV